MEIVGRNGVREIIENTNKVTSILIQNDLHDNESNELIKKIKTSGIKYQFVTRQTLDKISINKKHQGFIATATDYEYFSLEEIFETSKISGEPLLLVILDGIEDPHNFGNIIRSCECAGVNGIIIPERRNVSVTETVIRVSMGAINHTKICRVKNLNQTIDYLKESGVWLFALESEGQSIYKTNLKGNIALVVGSEGDGISKLTKEKCDEIISLPMMGKINSLNASNACAIGLYEAIRQRININ